MPLIPTESLPYFENVIYFPMLISILERDRKAIESGPFKLKKPYLKLIDEALKTVRSELKGKVMARLRNTYLSAEAMRTTENT